MPQLVRFYIRHVLIGLALSVVFTAILIGFDVAHLRRLIFGSDIGYIAVAMLVVFNTVVFGGVQFGIAVMAQAEPEGSGGGGARAPERAGGARPLAVAEDGKGGGNRSDRAGVNFPRA